MLKKEIIILVVVVALLFGAGGFFGGMKYQQMQRGNFRAGGGQGNFAAGGPNGPRGGGPGGPRGGGMGGAVIGDIISQDDKSITVKMNDGSSKIIFLSDSATVSKTDVGSKGDLKVGTKVGVFGKTNPDGSVTAQNIQLNPMFRMGQNPSSTPSAK